MVKTVQMKNLIRCQDCNSFLVAEELATHFCLTTDDILFDTAGFISFDGGLNWISNDFLQRDKKGWNPTETGQNQMIQL